MKAALFILVVSIVAIAFSLMPPRDGEAQSQLPKKEVKPDSLKAEADSIVLQAVENNARAKVIAEYASYNTEESKRFLKLIDLFIRKRGIKSKSDLAYQKYLEK